MVDRSQLISSCFALATWHARSWAASRPEMADELRAEALKELVISAGQFDPEHPRANWPAFVSTRIRWALFAYVGGELERQGRLPEAPPMPDDEGGEVQAVDLVAVDATQLDSAVCASISARVEAEVRRLPARELIVVALRYYGPEARTLQAVGDVLGVTRERVRQIEAKAFGRLREALE